MNRRHFMLWMGSMGVAAAAGTLMNGPKALNAATMRHLRLNPAPMLPHPAGALGPAKPIALIYDRDYLLYEGPRVGVFQESASRLQAIVKRLGDLGLSVETEPVSEASYEQLARVHTPRYIKYIKKAAFLPQDEYALIRRVERRLVNTPSRAGDHMSLEGVPTPIPHYQRIVRLVRAPADAPKFTKLKPYTAAALAAGGAIKAVDQVMSGRSHSAFALVRPPGHHATRSRNMGFCVFNNAGVAARHAQAAYGAQRVMIIDWDVHHGNGTQEIFYNDPSVLYFSTHQENIYPKRTGKVTEMGEGTGKGYNINVPLPPGTGDEGFIQVFREILAPVARSFKPNLIIISAGQDAHLQDIVAQMRMTDAGFAQLTRIVKELAVELCGGRLVFVLEGGYNPKVAARAVETIVRVLQAPEGADDFLEEKFAGGTTPVLRARIAQVKHTQLAHWPVLG